MVFMPRPLKPKKRQLRNGEKFNPKIHYEQRQGQRRVGDPLSLLDFETLRRTKGDGDTRKHKGKRATDI